MKNYKKPQKKIKKVKKRQKRNLKITKSFDKDEIKF